MLDQHIYAKLYMSNLHLFMSSHVYILYDINDIMYVMYRILHILIFSLSYI